MDVRANIEKAIAVQLRLPYSFWTCFPPLRIIHKGLRRVVTPRELLLFKTAAGGIFPLRFCRQTETATRQRAEPFAIRNGVEPGRSHHWLQGIGEVRIGPI